MGVLKSNRKPTFFWQGLLILLPVLIMAVAAISAIIQDRAAVEREAQQRAGEILQQLNARFGGNTAGALARYETCLQWWTDEHLMERALWPGSAWRHQYANTRAAIAASTGPLIQSGVPAALVAGEPVKFWPAFNEDGFIRGRSYHSVTDHAVSIDDPPKPPSWFLQLSRAQAAAWDDLCRLSARSNNAAQIEGAVQRFIATSPSTNALISAEFIRLRARAATEPASNAVTELVDFSLEQPEIQAESGIPLSDLALAEALKRAPETQPTENLWRCLNEKTIMFPDFFTPVLLDLAVPLTNRNPALAECLDAMRQNWEATQTMWAMGELIQQSGKLRGVTPTNFWTDFNGNRWLCVVYPEFTHSYADPSRSRAITNVHAHTELYTRAQLAWAFTNAFANTLREERLSLPPYLAVELELQDAQPFQITPSHLDARPQPGKVLASAEGALLFNLNANDASTPESRTARLNGAPHYVLRVYLADRGLMLAAHRQRVELFGGLILVSAMAALIGFLAARHAFLRQLRLSEMKSNFVSSVSHELRAPIASVRLMAEGLERGKIQDPQKQHEYFHFITQECRRLSALIENVLDFSRIEQGRKLYEFESTELVALAEQTAKLMEASATEQQIQIVFQQKGVPIPLELDGKAIQQALINLIDNAIKHSPKNSVITVGVDFDAGSVSSLQAVPAKKAHAQAWTPAHATHNTQHFPVQLWVEDQGEGIPAEEHEKIFERFYRRGSELRRQTQGVGIGLSIVKHIIEAHGGRVVVCSAPGEGSRFTILLPR